MTAHAPTTAPSPERPPAGNGPTSGCRTGPVLGIIGGGQLARMLAQAASKLGVATVVLERDARPPAAAAADRVVAGDWSDPDCLRAFAGQVDAVTVENEFVDADALDALEAGGVAVWPPAGTLRQIQDKLRQREMLASAGLPVPGFEAVESPGEIVELGGQLGWPLMLKKRRLGYDGRGNAAVRGPRGVGAAWQRLDGAPGLLLAEAFCPFEREIAVMVCRGRDGRMVTYPVVETVQRDHICHVVQAPAAVTAAVARQAAELARQAVEACGAVGCVGVEFFLMRDGGLVINELAPRVHNSGHYTIEACTCSQFENHVRAVLGWPLGSPSLRAPAAAMVNLLGDGDGPGRPRGVERALAIPGVHLHVYGKANSAPGRKMGHLTVLGPDLAQTLHRARRAARLVKFGTPS